MKTIIGILGLIITVQAFGQSDKLVGKGDDIIDTIESDGQHYIRFFRKESAKRVDLDFDNYKDTIEWSNFMQQSIERQFAFFDFERRISVKNKHGALIYKGDWEFIKDELKNNSTTDYKVENLILSLMLDNKTTALILAKRLTGSDIDAYTIIKIDSVSKPQVIFDAEFILTSIKDLDNDGFCELIGRHPNFGIPEYTMSYVPFMVYTYSDSLLLDNKLTYSYNLPYKKYREFPESSITILTEENLEGISKEKLRLMRNEIFADYGYVFTSADLTSYFSKKPWYKPRPDRHFVLTDWEKKNVETLKRMEAR